MNSMKATRSPTLIEPAATRAPPNPMTTRKTPWTAVPPIGPMSACNRAIRMPAAYAWCAAAPTPAVSRSWALLARMVRAAVIARSTADVISPMRAWASFDAGRIRRRENSMTKARIPATPAAVTTNSTASIRIMPAAAPTTITTPVTVSNKPEVTTARSSVVSAPTRDSRSPVRRWSYSVMGSRNRWLARRRRAERTRPSAVRDSR
jgi:hypothetical protein